MTDNAADKPKVEDLIVAVRWNDLDSAEDLLEQGVDVNGYDGYGLGFVALMVALDNPNPDMVRLLVDWGADPHKNVYGVTPLQSAERRIKSSLGYNKRAFAEIIDILKAAEARRRLFVESMSGASINGISDVPVKVRAVEDNLPVPIRQRLKERSPRIQIRPGPRL